MSAAIIFVVAKSIAAGREGMIDQFAFWLLGILPYAIFAGVSRVGERWLGNAQAADAFRFWSLAWFFSLGIFIFLRTTYLADAIERPLLEWFDFQFTITDIVTTPAFVAIGTVGALGVETLRLSAQSHEAFGKKSIGLSFVLNCILFYVLLFAVPAAA